MKKSFNILKVIALTTMAICTSSCYFRFTEEGKREFRELNEILIGSEEIGMKSTDLTPFDRIEVYDGIDVHITQIPGDSIYRAVASTSVNLLENLGLTVKDSILTVRFTGDVARRAETEVEIYAPMYYLIETYGSGDLEINGFRGDTLSISMMGSGDADLEDIVLAGGLSYYRSGSGDAELAGLAKSLSVKKSGSGDVDATSFKAEDISIEQVGSGTVKYKKDGQIVEQEN